MAMSQVVQFSDGIRVEIAGDHSEGQPVSSSVTDTLTAKFSDSVAAIRQVVDPIYRSLETVAQAKQIQDMKVEIGFAFSASGNLVLLSGKAEGTLKLTLTIKGT